MGRGSMRKRVGYWMGTISVGLGLLLAVPLPTQGQPHKTHANDGPAFRPPGLPHSSVRLPKTNLLPRIGLSTDRPGRSRRLRSFVTRTRQPRTQNLDTNKIRVIDGDTFVYGHQRIRLLGIDTPELSETGGVESADRLRALLQEGPVTMVSGPTDDYGRTLADVFVNHRNVAQILTAEGYAKRPDR
ncbi:MAG: thermonuclease family protein [Nitrospirae bacterium]|nr:thermonuclease family protein [Nitrospirota bacterium]